MQPIYIEPSDEITTVIERMKEASDLQIALVVPRGAILLQSIVNLKLAKKAASDSGKELNIITTDKIGRNLATQLGIKVYTKINQNNIPEEDGEELEIEDGLKVISGIKVHRYYDEKESEHSEENSTPNPEPSPTKPTIPPIIPKEVLQEAAPPVAEEEKESAPIVVREVKQTAEQTPITVRQLQNIEIIPPKKNRPKALPPEPNRTKKPPQQKKPLPNPKKARFWRRIIYSALYLILIFILSMGAVATYYLPKTSVVISVKSTPWQQNYQITAKVNAAPSPTQVAAQLVSVNNTDNLTYQSTGSKNIGSSATGTALIFNSYSSNPETLPAGAIFTANGQTFTTDAAVTVPGAQVQAGNLVAGKVSVNITATQPGTAGNMSSVTANISSPNSHLNLGQIVSTAGGSTNTVKIVTQTDLANARDALSKKIQTGLQTKLVDSLKGQTVLDDPSTDGFSLSAVTFSSPSGAQVDSFTASAQGTLTRLMIPKNQVETTVSALALASQPNNVNKEVKTITENKVTVNLATQSAVVDCLVEGDNYPQIPLASLPSQIIGKSQSTVQDLISLIDPNSSTSIQLTPAWWPNKHFPFSSKYIQISVKHE
jgi:hypothetical protein